MKCPILLDTHIFLWAFLEPEKLSVTLKSKIINPTQEIYVSSASAWEISIKYHLGKLPDAAPLLAHYESYLRRIQFLELPIQSKHTLRAGTLPPLHKDPFDRILVAQAQSEKMLLASTDPLISQYEVALIN